MSMTKPLKLKDLEPIAPLPGRYEHLPQAIDPRGVYDNGHVIRNRKAWQSKQLNLWNPPKPEPKP